MKRSSIIILFLVTILFDCRQSPNNDIAMSESNGKDLNQLDVLIQNLETEGMYGSFLLMENDSVLFQKSIGFSNKERGIRNNSNTIYLYGSIVKDYTMALMFLLESEGKLNTNDKISKYFENVPEDKKNITIGQVINHTSGLVEYQDLVDENVGKKYQDLGYPNDLFPMTRKENLDAIFSAKLRFKPGTGDGYSNAGYTLLAILAEEVTGRSFEDLIHQYILKPAKTKTADFYASPLWKKDNVAVGYSKFTYGEENSPVYWPRNPGAIKGNGGLAGSLMDIYLGTRHMLSLEQTNPTFRKLAKKYKYTPGIPMNYHGSAGGGMLGFVAFNFVIKDKDQYLIYASNNNTEGEDENMLRKVMKLGFGFDIASIAPGEFADETKGEEEVNTTNKGERNKWGLPNKLKYDRVGAFIDLLSNKIDLETFKTNDCTDKFSGKVSKLFKTWQKSEHLQYHQVTSYGTEMELILKDTLTQKEYIFDLKLEKDINVKFKSIKFKK
ncbi:serine hydrolase domain-containing protein [uncultured Winogradskyella sp.]|uniref:serine hydrolase domain-containing protein n=1 Tax=uncultured Winogradskyella sp. TaxID=395353 RepID=UPI002617CE52|nr:serine hydrolase domain-containing protein [uncultured Winogradskyella sp.]